MKARNHRPLPIPSPRPWRSAGKERQDIFMVASNSCQVKADARYAGAMAITTSNKVKARQPVTSADAYEK